MEEPLFLSSTSLSEIKNEKWDVILIGGGHNGLTCASYIAKWTKKRVLVLEKSERIGGACTLQRWKTSKGDLIISPCAYVASLLHPIVIEEFQLVKRGLKWNPASGGFFIPFEDGTSILLPEMDDKSRDEEIRKFASEKDVIGYSKMIELFDNVLNILFPKEIEKDVWLGTPPTRKEIEQRFEGTDFKELAKNLLFEWSISELLDHFLETRKLKAALLGQGIIGTYASPFDKGTAYIFFHHMCGRMFNTQSIWGYITGGMGTISRLLYDVALENGVSVVTKAEVSKIFPGEGVQISSGDMIRSSVIIANCDPKTCLKLLEDRVENSWKMKVNQIPIEGCVAKINVALTELPNFKSRPGIKENHHLAMINFPLTHEEWKECYEDCRNGRLPKKLWSELYFQTAVDMSVSPNGLHHISMFAQYLPYEFADGRTWESHRDEVKKLAIDTLSKYCSNIPQSVVDVDVMGPPDIEKMIGLHRGHIFQGECLPNFMWSERLSCETPMKGFFLCGAATHPGGSVIAANGRNCAQKVKEFFEREEKK